jgi:C1A family cysteine protease
MKGAIAAILALAVTSASGLEVSLIPGVAKPFTNPTHYGDPAGGCMSDEQSVQVTGLSGDFCSPPCTGVFKTTCPSDVPDGVTATPQCALQDASSGSKYCALICQPGKDDGACGTGSCQAISGVGICTYSSSFAEYVKEHNLNFSASEYTQRERIFVANVARIEAHNSKNLGWTMKMNHFGHMTGAEFKAMISSPVPKPDTSVPHKKFEFDVMDNAATSVDWTTKGAVTAVKNQASCGSCWAFSTTGGLEGAYFLANNKLVSFSEQELVSCDPVDQGCNGGLMDNAFNFIKKNGGLCTESDYPYTSGTGSVASCKKSCTSVEGSTVTAITDVSPVPQVTPATVAQMEAAVAKQPVSIAIEADQSAFQFYSSGIMSGSCGTQLDHGVLAVGYGTDGGSDYWKIKNSWGAGWGDDGYIRIAKGLKQRGGQCGILLSASYPSV